MAICSVMINGVLQARGTAMRQESCVKLSSRPPSVSARCPFSAVAEVRARVRRRTAHRRQNCRSAPHGRHRCSSSTAYSTGSGGRRGRAAGAAAARRYRRDTRPAVWALAAQVARHRRPPRLPPLPNPLRSDRLRQRRTRRPNRPAPLSEAAAEVAAPAPPIPPIAGLLIMLMNGDNRDWNPPKLCIGLPMPTHERLGHALQDLRHRAQELRGHRHHGGGRLAAHAGDGLACGGGILAGLPGSSSHRLARPPRPDSPSRRG